MYQYVCKDVICIHMYLYIAKNEPSSFSFWHLLPEFRRARVERRVRGLGKREYFPARDARVHNGLPLCISSRTLHVLKRTFHLVHMIRHLCRRQQKKLTS